MLDQLEEQRLLETPVDMLEGHDILNIEKTCLPTLESNDAHSIDYYLLAKARIKHGNLQQAKTLLEMALALDPCYIPYGLDLADIYSSLGYPDQAAALYKKLLALYPNDKNVADRLRAHYSGNDINMVAAKVRTEVDELVKRCNVTKGQKVLFGISFSIYEPCRIHDFCLSQALKLRGADVISLSTVSEDNGKIISVEEGETKIFGGIWGGFTGVAEQDKVIAEKNFRILLKNNKLLWENWAGVPMIPLTKYITEEDRRKARNITIQYPISDYKQWQYNSMPVGRWAVDALVNNEMVGDETLVENWEKKLYNYLYNIILLRYAFSRALDDIQPDVVISNDTYYYPYAVLETLAIDRSIPCYNHWTGVRKRGWSYAKGEPVMERNLSTLWKSCIDKPLTVHESSIIEDYIEKRQATRGMAPEAVRPITDSQHSPNNPEIDYNKPTALLVTNVIWDLAAMNKGLLFEGMVDWVCKVMDFFKLNPQYQLIIKTHPAEKGRKIPLTQQMVGDEVRRHMPVLPPNIILLEPETPLTTYDIIPNINVGLVYTSTVGIEISCSGKPVITCAKDIYREKGFTYDPAETQEYFETLTNLLESSEPYDLIERRKELAKKFFYIYYFRYSMSLDLFDYDFCEKAIPFFDSAKDLLPGKNRVLDYVCDSILGHLPVVSENRIPPAGGYKRNMYDFAPEEVVKGGRIVLKGYGNNCQETTIGQSDEFTHMNIAGFEFYVPTGVFKPGELAWLFAETFLPYKDNPHAYETDFLKMQQGDVVIDAGSCEGFFVPYALARNASKVYAFEPHPKLASGLLKTFEKQTDSGCVEVVPAALSDKIGESFLDDGDEFICEAKMNSEGQNKIQVVDLDSFVAWKKLTAVDFIKIDVEGQEMAAVRGMYGILKRFKPKLSIAVYHDYDNARQVKQLILRARPDYKVTFGGCYMFKKNSRPYMVYAY